MAKTGSITITQNSQNIANNTSSITVVCKITTSGESWRGTHRSGTCTINGTTYEFKSGAAANSTTTIFSKTVTVSHNSDGTKTVSASFNYDSGWCTASASKALTNIPRNSTFSSVSGSTIGSDMTVNITRHSTNYKHDIYYRIGGSGDYITAATGVDTTSTFKLDMSLCNSLPNATSGSLQILLRTYNGSTKIGSDVIKTITVNIPTSVSPTISSLSVSEAVSGLDAQFGVYIKNKSKLQIDINASGSYSSTITNYSTTISGVNTTYSGSSFSTGILTTTGVVTVLTTVTDSRGRIATSSQTINVVDYTAPVINSFTVIRCNSDGTENNEGTYIKANFSVQISPVNNKNIKSLSLQYKNDTIWVNLSEIAMSEYSLNSNYTSIATFSVDNSFQFRLVLKDYFVTQYATGEISTSYTLINFHADGHGLALGRASSGDGFDVDMNSRFRKNIIIDNNMPISWLKSDNTESPVIKLNSSNTVELSNSVQFNNSATFMNSTKFDAAVELYGSTPCIDFHYGNSTSDYTSRLIEKDEGRITCTGKFKVDSTFKAAGTNANVLGCHRFENENINFYPSYADADSSTNRKGWIGHDSTTTLNIKNEVGDVVIYASAAGASVRPYYRKGDTVSITIRTSGYTTNSKSEIHFIVPLTKPIVGVSSVTAASGSGFTFRQNDSYTHGTSSNTEKSPSSYSCTLTNSGILIKATFSTTTNATNNDAIGIYWNGTITFA